MNFDAARLQMVEQQVRAWDVLDPETLEVMASVPREQFMPAGYETLAFADTEIPIGHGEIMMTPTVEGRVLQALDLDGADSVLEIGTGTGFLTACLARLAGSVVSIDIHADFIERAGQNLADTGLGDVELQCMDAMESLPDGRFDAIAVTGSIAELDQRFLDALNVGGRLFVIVGTSPVMDARLISRVSDDEWSEESLFETELPALVNGGPEPQFLF
ncbi:MAG: protein-L-isoaspartate O-methyltransferase [Pseudomonadota bacterium]